MYIAPFWPRWYTQSAQAWITQFYLQITPCLPFLRARSPDATTTATEAADIQLPARSTQPPALGGTGNEYQPKCGDALRVDSKDMYGSFHKWMNLWVAGPILC